MSTELDFESTMPKSLSVFAVQNNVNTSDICQYYESIALKELTLVNVFYLAPKALCYSGDVMHVVGK